MQYMCSFINELLLHTAASIILITLLAERYNSPSNNVNILFVNVLKHVTQIMSASYFEALCFNISAKSSNLQLYLTL
jgi:hypothetical protein